MKVIKEKAHQLYQVLPEYKRFDQKFNMTRRPTWDWTDYGKTLLQNRIKLLKQGKTGYSLKDWAMNEAFNSRRRLGQTDINIPNKGHSSWLNRWAEIPSGVERFTGDSSSASRYVGKMAYLLGADKVGFADLDRRWIYSRWYDEESRESYPILFSDETTGDYSAPTLLEDRKQVIPEEMNKVVVMIVAMDKAGMDAAPTVTEQATTARTYEHLSTLVLGVAEFIRGLGYHALPMVNDTALSIPLAIDAGLGQLGRHGMLITPSFGPRCRICKVLTDLPLPSDWPIDFGVTAFCDVCRKCADRCPAGAITKGKRSYEAGSISSNPGVLKWTFDAEGCRRYHMSTGTNCGICIRVCPYNKNPHWFHSAPRWVIENLPPLNPFWVKMDNLFSYGKFKDPEKYFWRTGSLRKED